MGDPLNADSLSPNRRSNSSWEKFDEISMTTPAPPQENINEIRRASLTRDESLDIGGRDSVAAEAHLDVDDGDRPVLTPLPTNEMIADPAKLEHGSVVLSDFDVECRKRGTFVTSGGIELTNSKRLATVFPENAHCAWLVPPRYTPTSMPAILAADGIAVPGEDYVTAMELITNDYRFRSFSTLYSRLIAFWMTVSILILLVVLFLNTEGGLPIMIFCLFWVFMLFAGIVGCAIIRRQIKIGLRHCVQSANKVLIKHNILTGIEDKGQLSCHKVVLHFLWFRADDCIPDIERLIRIEASGGAVVFGGEAHAAPAKEVTKQEVALLARQLILKYSQGYVKDTVKRRIIFPSRPSHGVSDMLPKHCAKQQCLCQYIEKKHFNRGPRKWYAIFA